MQDETGLDIERLRQGWYVTAYGKFPSPHRAWTNNPHALRLVKYYRDNKSAGELPFKIGYRKEAGSALLVGNSYQAQMPGFARDLGQQLGAAI